MQTKLTIDAAFRLQELVTPLWILEQDRDPQSNSQLPPNQRRILYHSFPGQPSRTCQPDAAFRFTAPLDRTRPSVAPSDVIGFFELDCSTEGRKQILSKLPGYERLLKEHAYARYFPNSDQAIVRVFWICHSKARIHSLQEHLAEEPVAQFFRFTTQTELTPTTALTTPIWQDTTTKRREILRLPTRT